MFSTKVRLGLSIILALGLAACGVLAAFEPTPTPVPTGTPLPSSTPEPTATSTPTPTVTIVPTATPNLKGTAAASTVEAFNAAQRAESTAAAVSAQQTQQVEDAVWAQLIKDGSITYDKGILHEVEDFEESWAQRNWYQWWSFDYNLSDFVLTTHVDWESSQNSGLAPGGCGFVIRLQDNNNHLVVFLGTDNGAGLGQMTPQGYQNLNWRGGWENPDLKKVNATKGSADFVVTAEKEKITAYINGIKAYKWIVARTSSGDMGYTIMSGTNKDFGTYCKMTNTRIWELIK